MRVVVQCSDPLLRDLLAQWLRRQPQVSTVVFVGDNDDLRRLCLAYRPGLVVLEPGDVPENGFSGGRLVPGTESEPAETYELPTARSPDSAHPGTGARGIDGAAARTPPRARKSGSFTVQPPNPALAVRLTARELDVLRLLSQGRRSVEIGTVLGVSTRTVENHKRRIFAKLDVHSETQAVAEAIRLGVLLRPPTAPVAQLTRRESEILRLAATGHSVKQTARVLNISVKTVESIQRHLFLKLGVRGRTGAVAAVYGGGPNPDPETNGGTATNTADSNQVAFP